jgi:hypothetical protein
LNAGRADSFINRAKVETALKTHLLHMAQAHPRRSLRSGTSPSQGEPTGRTMNACVAGPRTGHAGYFTIAPELRCASLWQARRHRPHVASAWLAAKSQPSCQAKADNDCSSPWYSMGNGSRGIPDPCAAMPTA